MLIHAKVQLIFSQCLYQDRKRGQHFSGFFTKKITRVTAAVMH